MSEPLHPAASQHLPSFITAPGEADVLMIVMAIILALAVLAFGILFFRLHTMPERMAHKSQKVQFEIVAVLGLLALFTHMHIFWVAGLLLALIDLPDFGTSLSRIAGSVEKLAGKRTSEGNVEPLHEVTPVARQAGKPAEFAIKSAAGVNDSDGAAPTPMKSEPVSASRKELGHA
jgi:NADH:ubiquinone oxidoreductase subunit 5 (subunit L)/multisubunit Na+/H+ antiporter MnhA subunit